jgi:hypothetical protein
MSNQAESQAKIQARANRVYWNYNKAETPKQTPAFLFECKQVDWKNLSVTPILRYRQPSPVFPREYLSTLDWGMTQPRFNNRNSPVNYRPHSIPLDYDKKVSPIVNRVAKIIAKQTNKPIQKVRDELFMCVAEHANMFNALDFHYSIQVAKRRYQAEIRMVKRVFPMQDRDCLGLICEYAYGELGSAIHDPEMPAGVYTGRRLKIKVPASMKHTGAINMCNDIVNSIVDNL